MKAKDFEQQLDDSVDLTSTLDLPKARRALQDQKTRECRFPNLDDRFTGPGSYQARRDPATRDQGLAAERLEAGVSSSASQRMRADSG